MSILHVLEEVEEIKIFPFARVFEINKNVKSKLLRNLSLNGTPPDTHEMTTNIELFKKSYQSSVSCGLMAYPLGLPALIDLDLPMPLTETLLPVKSSRALHYAVTQAINRPLSVVNAVERYLEEAIGNLKYIGIHWRYDKNDYIGGHCYKPKVVGPTVKETYVKICEIFPRLKPIYVAKAINKAMVNLNTSLQNIPIYIGAPSSLTVFRDEIYAELLHLNKIYSKPNISLESFFSRKDTLCWKRSGWNVTSEIISLAEMEIMTRSSWFFFSHGSSWSTISRHHRVTVDNGVLFRKFEANNFELVLKEMQLE